MALETLIAGRYSSTYNAVDTGIPENGYELEQGSKVEMIDESDAYGGSAIDGIYRGGDCFVMFDSLAYKAGSIAAFWPWGVFGRLTDPFFVLGRLLSDVATPHVLTSTANTPAAAAPASLTGAKAILAPNQSARLLFNSKLRKVPVRLQYLPNDAGAGIIRWFV